MLPPASCEELLSRGHALAGLTLGALAARLDTPVPEDLRRAKGWVGTLFERALGATAQSRAVPDFEALGIELKTLPVSLTGRPLETTFVCTIPLLEMATLEWQQSGVFKKLQRVLWVPVEGTRTTPVGARRIGTPLLWSPSPQEEADLRFDWEELAGMIGCGRVEDVTGHFGRFLQVRPKAADSHARRRASSADGVVFRALPRGFYLRTQFTARILKQHFALGQRE
ncbi:MAG TPA: DNA mismatch repair endonuclease MutH [Polyangiaceae bacterium]|nr:DNA mismatch repair endonuclease MutH [Polyangiaceae bacterium]